MPRLLVIDNDNLSHKAITNAVCDTFDVVAASSGREGIDKINEYKPDAVLVGVEMPGINGYQVCEELRSRADTSDIPIIFMSSRSSLRERMLGIECGGDDYLVKPCSRDDLLTKLNAIFKAIERQDKLKMKIAEAEKTALMAMTGSSELGRAMLFVELSYDMPSHDVLLRKLLSSISELRLNCAVYCASDCEPLWYSNTGEVSQLEQQTIMLLRDKGRIFDFGSRTQINYQRISLLVKNMPVTDAERYGRIKDILPVMLGAADVKIRSLNTDRAIVKQAEDLAHSFSVIRSTLEVLGSSLKRNQRQGIDVMRAMIDSLVHELPRMGLEDDQEAWIVNLIDNAIKQATDLTDSGDYIASSFNDVMDNLQSLVGKQDDMVRDILANTPTAAAPQPASMPTDMDSVELF